MEGEVKEVNQPHHYLSDVLNIIQDLITFNYQIKLILVLHIRIIMVIIIVIFIIGIAY